MPGRIDGDCGICNEKKAIYRCPKCSIIYCSLGCFKPHKDSCTSTNQGAEPINAIDQGNVQALTKTNHESSIKLEFDSDDEDTDLVPIEVLKKLGDSTHLKGLLNNKHLQAMLEEVNGSQIASKAMEKAMQVPIFTEFADECLRIVEPQDESIPAVELSLS